MGPATEPLIYTLFWIGEFQFPYMSICFIDCMFMKRANTCAHLSLSRFLSACTYLNEILSLKITPMSSLLVLVFLGNVSLVFFST